MHMNATRTETSSSTKRVPHATIPQLFFDRAAEKPDEQLLGYKAWGAERYRQYRWMTTKELASHVCTTATYLRTHGIRSGDTVGIYMKNGPEWVIADLAIMSIGAIVVPLHTTSHEDILTHIIRDASIKAVCVLSPAAAMTTAAGTVVGTTSKPLPAALASLQHFFIDTIVAQDTATKGSSSSPRPALPQLPTNPHALATIIYTSGTTDVPKGVEMTHYNTIFDVFMTGQAVLVRPGIELFLSFLPLSHSLEHTAGYYIPLLLGGRIAYAEDYTTVARNIREIRPTIVIGVPRFLEKAEAAIWRKVHAMPELLQHLFLHALRTRSQALHSRIVKYLVGAQIRRGFGGRLRGFVSGGASLDKSTFAFFQRIGIKIIEGYGLTECAPIAALNREFTIRAGTVGQALPGTELRIAEDKEILIRGPHVMRQYHNIPQGHPGNPIDSDGWLHTKDLGFIDDEGYLTIIGRQKEIIILSGGKKVWPEPVEARLMQEPHIRQAMIVGTHQKYVAALIVPERDSDTGDAIDMDNAALERTIAHEVHNANSHLSEHETIKKYIILNEEFSQANGELSPTLKLCRHIIARNHKKEIEGLYKS
jgi:long-chain acyl-CoA synthetase